MLVDKNGGQDYSVDTLKRWKSDHETTIRAYLNGRHRVRLVGPFGDADLARKMLLFLEQRGVLFVPMEHEVPAFVMDSTKEIRTFLTSLQAELEPHSPLAAIASAINGACRSFMNHTPPGTETSEVLSSLGALRKTVTLSVVELVSAYGLTPTGPLADGIASTGGLS